MFLLFKSFLCESCSSRQTRFMILMKSNNSFYIGLLHNPFLFQCCNTRAVRANEEEVAIQPRRESERLSPRHKSRNSRANFAEVNTWPSLAERSFQSPSNLQKLKSKSGFKIAAPNGRGRLLQKWNSAYAHPGTCSVVLTIREFTTATSTVTLATACLITFVNQVSVPSFVTLSCRTHQHTKPIQTFDRWSTPKWVLWYWNFAFSETEYFANILLRHIEQILCYAEGERSDADGNKVFWRNL